MYHHGTVLNNSMYTARERLLTGCCARPVARHSPCLRCYDEFTENMEM